MADKSPIEWTDATWNPVTGCTKISAGCDNCYAARFSERFRGVPGHPFEPGFDLTLRPERLVQPPKWKRPRMIFVNSMSDLFHKDIPEAYISAVFETMESADWHNRTDAQQVHADRITMGRESRPEAAARAMLVHRLGIALPSLAADAQELSAGMSPCAELPDLQKLCRCGCIFAFLER